MGSHMMNRNVYRQADWGSCLSNWVVGFQAGPRFKLNRGFDLQQSVAVKLNYQPLSSFDDLLCFLPQSYKVLLCLVVLYVYILHVVIIRESICFEFFMINLWDKSYSNPSTLSFFF